MKGIPDFHKEINEMMNFSDIGSQTLDGHGPAKMMTRKYVYSSKIGDDGRKYEEKYFNNNY